MIITWALSRGQAGNSAEAKIPLPSLKSFRRPEIGDGSISISARCRLTPKGAATQTKPKGATDYKSEMLPRRSPLQLISDAVKCPQKK
ncbi:MAG: hypothetical protein F6J93_20625 [Oscillatoria sp. SIO1A7]|nr:hypothetical protein [Oscillatoria sp. SIO1A7]